MTVESKDNDDRNVSIVCVLACAVLLASLIVADKTVMAPDAKQSSACVECARQPSITLFDHRAPNRRVRNRRKLHMRKGMTDVEIMRAFDAYFRSAQHHGQTSQR